MIDALAAAAMIMTVTFRRRRSGRVFQVRFECGDQSRRLALHEAWNSDSEIVAVSESLVAEGE